MVVKMEITLNSGQEVAVSAAFQSFMTRQVMGHTIIGEGGTGKTFCVMELARRILDEGKKVLFTAPTNKAVKQLQKTARAAGLDMNKCGFRTVHKALGLALLPTAERPNASQVKEPIIGDYDCVVMDEGSMAGEILLYNHLLPELDTMETYCLVMGDDMQFNPVKELQSLAFGIFPVSELTQVERQQNNPDGTPNGILQITHPLRAAIKSKTAFKFNMVPEHNVTLLRDRDFLASVVAGFDLDTDLDNVRCIAWRNFRVNDINKAERKKLYGKDAARYEVGERVVTGGGIKDSQGEVILNTDEECIVRGMKESQLVDKESNNSYKTWLLTLEPIHDDSVKQVFAHVLHEDEYARHQKQLTYWADKAKAAEGSTKGYFWRKYHDFNDMFADIRYCYCITAHRAQGSTYKRGFLDVKDMLENPIRYERQRGLYVGFSRFSEHLTINKMGFTA